MKEIVNPMTKQMTSADVRQAFLDFFAKRHHQVAASSSLVPANDPTLLFTNAGMVQFKDVFLGLDNRDYSRATTSQKCMRISGKHNDLENVGPSPRHHTFFEMLGNFSFGDYFKEEAITAGYELLTKVYGLPPERLAFTVYETDDEAYRIWTEVVGVDPKRVARMGPKTNFWQMADTGPCGPTSEIHWDKNPGLGEDTIIDALVREDERFLELWNLVFMQFNRTEPDPKHTGKYDAPLPAPGVDTGMGLERIVSVVQGTEANYDTDLFADIMDATQEILGHDDETREKNTVAYRVIADHMRAATFLIADGVNPGPKEREYIARMVIRRALRFAHQMGVDKPFLTGVSEAVIHKMGDIYPELKQFEERISYQIGTEEDRFLRTLDNALGELESQIARMKDEGVKVMAGEQAFDLYQTHGLPLEITRDLLREERLGVDEEGFKTAQAAHSEISDQDSSRAFEDVTIYQGLIAELKETGKLPETGVLYEPYDYSQFERTATIVALLKEGQAVDHVDWEAGASFEIVLDATSFYVESGGQVSDTGIIVTDDWEFEIRDVKKPVGGLIVHSGVMTYGNRISVGDQVTAVINHHRRWDIMRNHTATHLLHKSLRDVLGNHVQQRGSLVAPDVLRFDFSHNEKVQPADLRRIEKQVNEMIMENEPVMIVEKPLDEARREGAMALFGEKYGSTVRTVTVPSKIDPLYSYELCGGTHVEMTGQIGNFIITREESTGSGVRRVLALTGHSAQSYIQDRLSVLDRVASNLNTDPVELSSKVEALREEVKALQKQLAELEQSKADDVIKDLMAAVEEVNGATILTAQVDTDDGDLLSWMVDRCREHITSGAVVLGAEIDGKARLVAKVTPDMIDKGIKAGEIIRQSAGRVGGGGGGRPDFASAGGKNPAGIPDAIQLANELIKAKLNG